MPNPRSIIAAVDFSPESDRAAHLALSLARARGVPLHLVYVHPAPELSTSVLGEPFYLPAEILERVGEHRQECAAKLAVLAAGLRELAPGAVIEERVRSGEPVSGIVGLAADIDAGLIVLATRGSGSTQFLLGSVACRVAQRAPCPVLVDPRDASSPLPGGFRQVLCAIDESSVALQVARLGRAFAADDGTIELAHVWHAPHLAWMRSAAQRREIEESATRTAESRLETIGAGVDIPRARLKTWTGTGSTAGALIGRAGQIGADLIVIGAHGRHGVERFLGTVADRVLRFATCAVLVVPASSSAAVHD